VSFVLAAAEEGGYEAPGVGDFWQPLVGDGPFALTRAAIAMVFSVALISGVLLFMTRRLSVVPTKPQMMLEGAYTFVRNGVGRDVIGGKEFLPYVPLLFSLFALILVNNIFGIVPFIQFPTMGRVGFPAALAIVVYFVYHWVGIKRKGLGGYFGSFVPHGLPIFVVPFVWLLEFITYFFTRPVTLALRLFGNMFAGHILLLLFIAGGEYLLVHMDGVMKLTGVFALVMGFVMTIFEILVQFLQAYVFILLTAVYIQASIADEH
jgi:F-type H+-transporting ATPase subunit a